MNNTNYTRSEKLRRTKTRERILRDSLDARKQIILHLSDQTLSTDMENYRQALRDITMHISIIDAEGFAYCL